MGGVVFMALGLEGGRGGGENLRARFDMHAGRHQAILGDVIMAPSEYTNGTWDTTSMTTLWKYCCRTPLFTYTYSLCLCMFIVISIDLNICHVHEYLFIIFMNIYLLYL